MSANAAARSRGGGLTAVGNSLRSYMSRLSRPVHSICTTCASTRMVGDAPSSRAHEGTTVNAHPLSKQEARRSAPPPLPPAPILPVEAAPHHRPAPRRQRRRWHWQRQLPHCSQGSAQWTPTKQRRRVAQTAQHALAEPERRHAMQAAYQPGHHLGSRARRLLRLDQRGKQARGVLRPVTGSKRGAQVKEAAAHACTCTRSQASAIAMP